MEFSVNLEKLPRVYIKILNGITGLSKKEMEILEQMFFVKGDILSYDSRLQIRDNLKITEENLNNYVCSLRKKKIIIKDSEKNNLINPNFIPKIENGKVKIGFEINII